MLRKTLVAVSTALALASSLSVSASPLVESYAAAPLPIVEQPQAETTDSVDDLLNLNTASAQQLAAVMIGVGVKRAEQIIKLREQLGGFTELEQLLDVKGIGLKTLEKNQALVRLD